METITLKLTKANLSKIIKWSTSRYNEQNKKDVVDEIAMCLKDGGRWTLTWKEFVPQGAKVMDGSLKFRNGKEQVVYLNTEIRKYESGTYCECSNMSRYGEYVVDVVNRTIEDKLEGVLYKFTLHGKQ